MKLIGITGGIGMGKSTLVNYLRSLHLPVVDTDEIAREIVGPGQPALQDIAAKFGGGVISLDGTLDRKALAELIFHDHSNRRTLEAILHPPIRQRWMNTAAGWRASGERIGFVVIPLLFETGAESEFDKIICVACSDTTQRERLAQRGWSPEHIDARLASQKDTKTKIGLADFVIWTEGSLTSHCSQMDRILAMIHS